MTIDEIRAFRLCYIDDGVAHFTTQELDRQWGDDWNDAPYEHNAGRPYAPYGPDESWELMRIRYDGECLETPKDTAGLNSWLSVQDINEGRTAWLWSTRYKRGVFAGCSPEQFREFVLGADGTVRDDD